MDGKVQGLSFARDLYNHICSSPLFPPWPPRRGFLSKSVKITNPPKLQFEIYLEKLLDCSFHKYLLQAVWRQRIWRERLVWKWKQQQFQSHSNSSASERSSTGIPLCGLRDCRTGRIHTETQLLQCKCSCCSKASHVFACFQEQIPASTDCLPFFFFFFFPLLWNILKPAWQHTRFRFNLIASPKGMQRGWQCRLLHSSVCGWGWRDEGGLRKARRGRSYLWKTTKLTEIQLVHVLVTGKENPK